MTIPEEVIKSLSKEDLEEYTAYMMLLWFSVKAHRYIPDKSKWRKYLMIHKELLLEKVKDKHTSKKDVMWYSDVLAKTYALLQSLI